MTYPWTECIPVEYWTSWENRGERFTIECLKRRDISQRISWEEILERVPEFQQRMLKGLQIDLRGRRRISGEEHQYSEEGVPVFKNSVALCMSVPGWEYLMSVMPE